MSEQVESLPSMLSRRTMIKGPAGCALAFAGVGCSSASPSSAHVTPGAAQTFVASPTPTPTTTPKPGTLGSILLTYRGHSGDVFLVIYIGTFFLHSSYRVCDELSVNTLKGLCHVTGEGVPTYCHLP